MSRKETVVVRFICLITAMCSVTLSSGCGPQKPPAQTQAEKAAAEAKLEALQGEKKLAAEKAAHARDLAIIAEAERRRQEEAAKPQYPLEVLNKAAQPRKWASITVPDLNIKCVFNSTWTNGNLNYRVAMLGERPVIENFIKTYSAFTVNFADQSGTNIYSFDISPSAFEWEPPNYNGGIPTVDTMGSTPCELPLYDQAVQWNFSWKG